MPKVISLTYIEPVLSQLEQLGHPIQTIFSGAGLSIKKNRVANLPINQIAKLYGHAIRLLESKTSRRTTNDAQSKEVTELLCYNTINCKDLEAAIHRSAAFNRILGPVGGLIRLSRNQDDIEIHIDSYRKDSGFGSFLVDLSAMIFYVQLFSWLIGRNINIKSVAMKYPPPRHHILITDLLGAPITYGFQENKLIISTRYLAAPIVRTEFDLTQDVDYFPFPFGHWIDDPIHGNCSRRVRRILLNLLNGHEGLPDATLIAEMINVSPATLRRRLGEEGTSYAMLRATCQRELAEFQLQFTDKTMQEIAMTVGFSDDRAFRRAFHSWTGITPTEYRKLSLRDAQTDNS